MDSTTRSINRSGFPGLSQIPGIGQVLAQNTRDTQTSQTLIVIKPVISRFPMASWISPQFLIGPQHGESVLL
jgi:type II secretory pathway component GspD/PulD (secretin)